MPQNNKPDLIGDAINILQRVLACVKDMSEENRKHIDMAINAMLAHELREFEPKED